MNHTHTVTVLVDKPIGVISSQAPEVAYFTQAYLYNIKISKSVSHSAKRTLPKVSKYLQYNCYNSAMHTKQPAPLLSNVFDVQNKIKNSLYNMIPLVSFIF